MSWVISLSIDTLFQTCAHQDLRTALLFCYHVPILSLLTLPAAWMFVYSQLLPLVSQLLFSPLSTKWFFSYSFTHFTLLLWRRYVGMIFDISHAHTYRKFISLATGKQIFLYVCVCVCECIYCIKPSLKLSLALFSQCLLQKTIGWVAFEVSFRFLLKFKPSKLWRAMPLFILLRFLLYVRKVSPFRKGVEGVRKNRANLFLLRISNLLIFTYYGGIST